MQIYLSARGLVDDSDSLANETCLNSSFSYKKNTTNNLNRILCRRQYPYIRIYET